ncbi:MAG: CAP domain-containing protein [Armatimonadota bacterium]
MRSRILMLACLLLSALMLPIDAVEPECATLAAKWCAGQYTGLDDIERAVVKSTNDLRAKAGLRPLTVEPALQIAARQHSAEMGALGYFAHESPMTAWRKSWQRTYFAGYWGQEVGENIALVENGKFTTPEAVAGHFLKLWIASPSHKANMLKAEWKLIGVGFVKCGNTYFGTQVFANPLVTIEEATISRASGHMVVARLNGTHQTGTIDIWVNRLHYQSVTPVKGEWFTTLSYPRDSGTYSIMVSANSQIVWMAELDTSKTEDSLGKERVIKPKVVTHASADLVPVTGVKLRVTARLPEMRQTVHILRDLQPYAQYMSDKDRRITFDLLLPARTVPYTITTVVKDCVEDLLFIDTKKPLAEAFCGRPN